MFVIIILSKAENQSLAQLRWGGFVFDLLWLQEEEVSREKMRVQGLQEAREAVLALVAGDRCYGSTTGYYSTV